MIVSTISLKGGVGKSTITQNIAVCFAHKGYSVCIADVDTNQSCLRWSEFRDDDSPTIPVYGYPEGKGLTKNVKTLSTQFDFVFVDGTPSLSRTATNIILLSDFVIIPVLAGVMDIWATELFLERFEEAKDQKGENIHASFLLNQYDKRLSISKETQTILKNVGEIPLLNSTLGNRVAFREATIKGQGVYEYTDNKAKKEIIELTEELENTISNIYSNTQILI